MPSDIDFEQWEQEDTIWPWLMDSEPTDYEWNHEEDE
jgi:hypothetical protein